MKPLTKQSSEADIKAYFCAVLNLAKSNEEFPVNLDDVWPLVYSRKDKAVRALKEGESFFEGIDYQPLPQNGERLEDKPLRKDAQRSNNGQFNGADKVTYMLSVPCLEFFIARKVRPVFEVYRQVFHKVAKGEVTPQEQFDISEQVGLEETLLPLSDYMHQLNDRWESLKMDMTGQRGSDEVKSTYNEWVATYRRMIEQISQLVKYETINKIEGTYFI